MFLIKFYVYKSKVLSIIIKFGKIYQKNNNYMDFDLTGLTKDDIRNLDFIIDESLKKGQVFPDDLPPIGKGYLNRAREVKSLAYQHYLDILSSYGVVKVDNSLSGFRIEPIDVKTKNFQMKGGFRAIYERQLSESQHQKESSELYIKKLRWDSKLSKWKVKTFWWLFIFAFIGGFYSIYDIVRNNFVNNQEQVTKSQLDSELTKMRALILDQQVISDSLKNIQKIQKDSIPK